jgi:competence protein ComEA
MRVEALRMADDSPVTPPTPRQALIARSEQAMVAVLALLLVAGVAYRVIGWWQQDTSALEAVPPSDGPSYRINVNTADAATLSVVPGVGSVLAQRIVAFRQTRPDKRFKSLDELIEVKGIGEKILAKLRPYLVLDGAPGGGDEPVRMLPAAAP